MSLSPAQLKVIAVDSVPNLTELLAKLKNLPINPPSLCFDLKGIRLGRFCSISIVSVYVLPIKVAFLVDVHILG
jgi:hypothetical protein